jgi:hypothetical protein
MNKILITISSWVGAATNGENQAIRDTFLKNIHAFPGLEYRFFIGDGTPTGEDETALWASFGQSPEGYGIKAKEGLQLTRSIVYTPKDDEIILPNTPDDYAHLGYKVRGQYRWALAHDFDFTFQIGSDCYVVLKRLMESGFENYDYSGNSGYHSAAGGYYAGGGGYWLSKKALQFIENQPLTFWAEDLWVGSIMNKNGITLHIDSRYAADYPNVPQHDNEIITSHLGIHNGLFGKYDPKLMYKVHANYEDENGIKY